MSYNLMFFVNSILLGVGLAMDAFSVSVANGLHNHSMKKNQMSLIAGTFALFQFLMPMLGWICVHTIVKYFQVFENFIPWIALVLLLFIGGKMIIDSIRGGEEENSDVIQKLSFGALMVQGVATSIDALSVGFTIAEYDLIMALVSTLIIGAVTFAICIAGLIIGKKFGNRFSDKAEVIGGVILILIGIEIFVTGIIG